MRVGGLDCLKKNGRCQQGVALMRRPVQIGVDKTVENGKLLTN